MQDRLDIAGREIAETFVKARLNGLPVLQYPAAKPVSLSEAYQVQDCALNIYPEAVAGWKVGGIGGDWRDKLGTSRLVGPVFKSVVHDNQPGVIPMPVYGDGFAAVEGEVTAVIKTDAPSEKTSFSTEDALSMIGSLHLGVEIASSPFPGINDHGPLVTISDFGNNRGLILGDEIPDWQKFDLKNWTFTTVINGEVVGQDTPTHAPGGPLESVRYALENTARRGRPVKAGTLILTGAVTGVHQAFVGDTACVKLNDLTPIHCEITPFTPA